MTLYQIVVHDSGLFYPQDWWRGHRFAHAEFDPETHDGSPTAAYLAWRYLQHPHSPIWRRFIWTSDTDDDGNRVYVGGLGQFKCQGFQIHRLLVPDDRWVEWSALTSQEAA